VGRVLLGLYQDGEEGRPRSLLLVEDAFAMTEPSVRAALGPAIDAVTATLGSPRDVRLSANGLEEGWLNAFRTLQMHEVWRTHRAWITAHKPHFGPGVAERFAASSKVTDSAAAEAGIFRSRVTEQMDSLLSGGDLLLLPTAPCIAPLKNTPQEELNQFRASVLSMTCIAGLARLPQVSLPAAEVEGCPVGLSLVARRGRDAAGCGETGGGGFIMRAFCRNRGTAGHSARYCILSRLRFSTEQPEEAVGGQDSDAEHQVAEHLHRPSHAHRSTAELVLEASIGPFGVGALPIAQIIRIGDTDQLAALALAVDLGTQAGVTPGVVVDDRDSPCGPDVLNEDGGIVGGVHQVVKPDDAAGALAGQRQGGLAVVGGGGGEHGGDRDHAIGDVEVQLVADPALLEPLAVGLGADVASRGQVGQHRLQGLLALTLEPGRLLGLGISLRGGSRVRSCG
jgi:hypothetical protein